MNALTDWCRRSTTVEGYDSLHSWAKRIYKKTERNATTRRMDFALTPSGFYEAMCRSRGHCQVSGVRFSLEHRRDHGRRRPFAPSIDRIDASRGYADDNVRIVCVAANYAMSDWGEAVLLEIARGMVKLHGPAPDPTIKSVGKALTPEQVAAIRATPRTRRTASRLARELGVHRRTIYRVLGGETYPEIAPARDDYFDKGRVA